MLFLDEEDGLVVILLVFSDSVSAMPSPSTLVLLTASSRAISAVFFVASLAFFSALS